MKILLKFLFTFLIVLFLIGCEGTHTDHYPASAPFVNDDEPEVLDIPDDSTTDISPLFALKIDNELYFSNHTEMQLWKTGNIQKSGSMEFSHEDYLYSLDSSGDEVSDQILSVTPTRIKNTDIGVFMCKEIPADEAYAAGGLYRIYSEIYKDNVIISAWYLNEFECKDIISSGSEVFAIDQTGAYQQLNGVYDSIQHVENGFIIHSWDSVNSRIDFNNNTETYGTNHILNAENWQLHDGLYYSENGFTWSESAGLSEAVTELWNFTESPYPVSPALPYGEQPVLLTAGIYDNELYWIECNSGWVFKYNPEIDRLTQEWRIFAGDGLHSTGILMHQVLNPVMVDFKLYFENDGSVYSLNVITGMINIFYGGNAELVRYD